MRLPLLLLLRCALGGSGGGESDRKSIVLMDCDPPAQHKWADYCYEAPRCPNCPSEMAQANRSEFCDGPDCRDASYPAPCGPPTRRDFIACSGRRLVEVHSQYGMRGILSLRGLWINKGCHLPNCTRSALPPNWAEELGAGLDELRPAFANGSLAGVWLGDELASDGVPVLNLSSVASLVKERLKGVCSTLLRHARSV